MSLIIRSFAVLLVLLVAWPPGTPAPRADHPAAALATQAASPPGALN